MADDRQHRRRSLPRCGAEIAPPTAGAYAARLASITGIPSAILEHLGLDPVARPGSACAIVKEHVGAEAWRAAGKARTVAERSTILLAAIDARLRADEAEWDHSA